MVLINYRKHRRTTARRHRSPYGEYSSIGNSQVFDCVPLLGIIKIIIMTIIIIVYNIYCQLYARRNINNLRYADDITLMAESEEELKSLLMKVKEESEKAGLK